MLVTTSSSSIPSAVEASHPDTLDVRSRHHLNITPKLPGAEEGPKRRERLAYKIEYCVKIFYPFCFLFFNILYWSYYLHYYSLGPTEW